MNLVTKSFPVSWRHRGTDPLAVRGKVGAVWHLEDGKRLTDCSGGTLVQSLAEVSPPPLGLLDLTVPSYGFDLRIQRDADQALSAAMGPGAAGLQWTTSGTDANEAALGIAAWTLAQEEVEIQGVATLRGSYHGASTLTAALSSRADRSGPLQGSWLPNCAVETRREDSAQDILNRFAAICDGNAKGWIALIEPLATSGWSFGWTPDLRRDVLSGLKQMGMFVVVDEIASGCFRHGDMFSTASEGLPGDIVTLSKGLTQGRQPLSVVVMGQRANQAMHVPGLAQGKHTFGLTPIAAWYVCRALERLQRTVTPDWRNARRRMLADLSVKLAESPFDIAASPTTLRIAGNPLQVSTLGASLRKQGLWCYATKATFGSKTTAFLHCCPMFDLPAEEQEAQFSYVVEVAQRVGKA